MIARRKRRSWWTEVSRGQGRFWWELVLGLGCMAATAVAIVLLSGLDRTIWR